MFDDLNDLYQEVILDHCKKPRNFHEMPQATCSAQGHNPLCGDQLKLFLVLEGASIKDISFIGSGCCISKASASLLTEFAKGKTKSDVEKMFGEVHKMVITGAVNGDVGKLAVFAGVHKYPAQSNARFFPGMPSLLRLRKAAVPSPRSPSTTDGDIHRFFSYSSDMTNEPKTLTRDVEASVVPVGTKVTLQQGEQAHITQSLGGTYTVIVNGNMFRIESKDADALGLKSEAAPVSTASTGPVTQEKLEKQVWDSLKTCYDPEIPVNIVDLGLIYDCHLTPIGADNYKADVKMTLTAPGCGMGPVLAQDVQNKLMSLEPIDEANVELVWDPPWNQGMMTEAAKLQLGLM